MIYNIHEILSQTMKVSFITTVYNEENTIRPFLNSLSNQTEKPDEVIIVDASSKDKTKEIIKSWMKDQLFPVILRVKKGNRSVGRNFAIKLAAGEVIAASDAGCVLDRKWLMKISAPFKKKGIDVVAGFYKPVTNSEFEKSLSVYTCVMDDKVNDDFLPSSRSIAFWKSAWDKVGGYPQDLDTCEDLVFAKRLKEARLKFFVEKAAFVYWPQRKNLLEAFRQFYSYAKGDGRARYHRKSTPLLYARAFMFALLAILFVVIKSQILMMALLTLIALYFVWAIMKNFKYIKSAQALVFLPLLQLVSDIAVFLGMTFGLISSHEYKED